MKPLSEMTDLELEEELHRRRRARAEKRGEPAGATTSGRDRLAESGRPVASSPRSEAPGDIARAAWDREARREEVRRAYSALELRPGASLEEVERAYRALAAKYDPGKHSRDPDKHAIARKLLQHLDRAYQTLLEELRK